MKVSISIRKVAYWLFGIILVLNAISPITRVLMRFFDFEFSYGFLRLFDTAEEANVTSWFSSELLFIVAILVLLISRVKVHHSDAYSRHWTILAAIFFFLSLDELASIHEMTINSLRNAFGATGLFYFSWVIIAIPLVLLLGFFFLRFVLSLPRSTRIQFIVAGTLFLTGAVGFEMLGGLFHESSIYRVFVTVEETLENLGAGIFIISLLSYAGTNLKIVDFEMEII